MRKARFSVTHPDDSIVQLEKKADHKTLAVWAIDCVERVMPYFEEKHPEDPRPRNAVKTLRAWIDGGISEKSDIRKAALASHAAAREVREDDSARSAARAAGQAVATAHVRTHSLGAAPTPCRPSTGQQIPSMQWIKSENWQFQRLLELTKSSQK
ncbi:MAG TPA: hypothetical protein VFF30_10135 [Nitrososphaerales archaeon]|nr:hypothetical protein [Nitrososphaerales archaeon]